MAVGTGVIFLLCFIFIICGVYYNCWIRRRHSFRLPVFNRPPVSPTPRTPPLNLRFACLFCFDKPKNGNYDFCGEACKEKATLATPLLLLVPKDHVTFEMVEGKFKTAWNHPQKKPCPEVKKVFRIIESRFSRNQYERYRNRHGNECFRYHGTTRKCRLGDAAGNQYPCISNTCPACCIIRSSFKTNLANPGGAFGKGVYTSSASNKSANYAPNGVMLLTKVVLGKTYPVNQFAEVKSCPSGYNSVIYDRFSGRLNETVVYTDDAIRPVFLIIIDV